MVVVEMKTILSHMLYAQQGMVNHQILVFAKRKPSDQLYAF